MKDQDVYSGSVLLLFSLWGVYYSGKLPHVTTTQLSSGFFPTLLFAGLGLCGAGLIYQSWIRQEKKAVPGFYWSKISSMMVLFIIYAFTLELLGFRLSTAVFVFACMFILGERKPINLLTIPLVTSLGIFYLFSKIFRIVLP